MTSDPGELQRDLESLNHEVQAIARELTAAATAASGPADALMTRYGGNARDRGDLTDVQTAVRRAVRLAGQLSALGSAAPPQPADVDIAQILAGVHRRLRGLLPEGISLRCHIDHRPAAVRLDSGQVEQALLNLVLNAQRTVARGSVRLDIPRDPGAPRDIVSVRILASGMRMPDLLDGDASAFGILRGNGGTLTVDRTASSVEFIVSFRASGPPVAADPAQLLFFTDASDPATPVQADGSDESFASEVMR